MVFDNNKLYFWKFCIIACLVWYLVLKKNLKLSFYSNNVKKPVNIVCTMTNNAVQIHLRNVYLKCHSWWKYLYIYVTCKAWHNTTSVLNHTLKIRSLL